MIDDCGFILRDFRLALRHTTRCYYYCRFISNLGHYFSYIRGTVWLVLDCLLFSFQASQLVFILKGRVTPIVRKVCWFSQSESCVRSHFHLSAWKCVSLEMLLAAGACVCVCMCVQFCENPARVGGWKAFASINITRQLNSSCRRLQFSALPPHRHLLSRCGLLLQN